jgi:hypothetical protein
MRTWVAVSLMVAGGIFSFLGIGFARERRAYEAVVFLGLISLLLWSGSTLWIALKLYSFIASRRPKEPLKWLTMTELPVAYTARYGLGDRTVALFLAAFFFWLSIFFASGPDYTAGKVIATCFCCFSVCYAIHLLVTRVRLTKETIDSRTWWGEEVSEPYSNLRRVAGKPGTLTLHFSDGRLIRLYAGLGNPDIVIAYLSKHAPKHVIHTTGES